MYDVVKENDLQLQTGISDVPEYFALAWTLDGATSMATTIVGLQLVRLTSAADVVAVRQKSWVTKRSTHLLILDYFLGFILLYNRNLVISWFFYCGRAAE